ncbi:MAG TPA: DUF3108 domain-containing protein [Rhizomicrobium sp.]|nr:DUF3108 domain-containing protein [Rhizomicrobium sp.]
MIATTAAFAQTSSVPPPQQRADANSITLGYTLRIFGISFGSLDYAARLGGRRYDAEIHFQTYGLAAVLWKAKIDTAAEGRVVSDALLPDFYTSRSFSRSGTQRWVRVDYTNGAPIMKADPPYDLSDYPVSDAQKRNAVDPVTAITSIIAGRNTSDREPCGRPLAIFDGRRRYDIVFTIMHQEPKESSGPHRRVCKGEYRHLAGLKQEVVDVSNVPAIYAEFVDVPTESHHYTIARAVWSSFMWRAVNARLTEVRIDSRPIALER